MSVYLNKRRELSKSIVDVIRGQTGNNFQDSIYIVLKNYYSFLDKTFEMPGAMCGDGKNDGWVKEDSKYYMLHAPIIFKESFYKSIQSKFRTDLNGLAKNVYQKKYWSGIINEVIFIVNTRDNRLPANVDDAYRKIVLECQNLYGVDFKHKVTNLEYIQDILEELNISTLEAIKFRLNIARETDLNIPNASEIFETIELISNEAMSHHLNDLSTDYIRISTNNKIKLNNLTEVAKEINSIIEKLGIVDNVVNELSQHISKYDQFNNTKNFIIKIYNENKDKFNGAELYYFMVEHTCDMLGKTLNSYSVRYLIVYIFDKCDIFEKEVQ